MKRTRDPSKSTLSNKSTALTEFSDAPGSSRCPSQAPPCLVHLSAANLNKNGLQPIAKSESMCTEQFQDLLADSCSLPLLVGVKLDKECLCGYEMADFERSHAADDDSDVDSQSSISLGPLRLRLPLLLARVWRLKHAAALGRHMLAVCIQPGEVVRKGLHHMHVNHVPPMPSKVSGIWVFECESEEAREGLFEQLQLAGCIMEGLEERYSILQLLGSGSTAQVFLAEDLKTGEPVAVKMVAQNGNGLSLDDGSALKEALLLHWLEHTVFLQFHGLYQTTDPETHKKKCWAIVVEFVGGGELFEEVRCRGRMAEAQARIVMFQLFSAVHFLHQRGIAHRDIKTENVIRVGGDFGATKLVDFGLAASELDSASMSTRCGSPGYIAPEVLRGERYGCKADCFSVGVLMYILLVGRGPFRGSDMNQLLAKNLRCRINQKNLHHVSADAKDLLMNLLVPSPDQRYTAERALAHPWLTNPGRHSQSEIQSTMEPIRRHRFGESLDFSDIFLSGLRFSDEPLVTQGMGIFESADELPATPVMLLPGAIDDTDLPNMLANDQGTEPGGELIMMQPKPGDAGAGFAVPVQVPDDEEELDEENLNSAMEMEVFMKVCSRESLRTADPIWADMQRTISGLRVKGLMPLDRDPDMMGRNTAFYSWDLKHESLDRNNERVSAFFMRDLRRQENSFRTERGTNSFKREMSSFNNRETNSFSKPEDSFIFKPREGTSFCTDTLTNDLDSGFNILGECPPDRLMDVHSKDIRSASICSTPCRLQAPIGKINRVDPAPSSGRRRVSAQFV